MVHFTCDLCGRDLTSSGERRYIVKMEAFAGFDPTEIKEDDLDEDPMEAVAQLLKRDPALVSDHDPDAPKGFRYDFCASCHEKFLKDPLGRDVARTFDFSKN